MNAFAPLRSLCSQTDSSNLVFEKIVGKTTENFESIFLWHGTNKLNISGFGGGM